MLDEGPFEELELEPDPDLDPVTVPELDPGSTLLPLLWFAGWVETGEGAAEEEGVLSSITSRLSIPRRMSCMRRSRMGSRSSLYTSQSPPVECSRRSKAVNGVQ